MEKKDKKDLLKLDELGIKTPTVFSFELQKSVPNMDGVRGILKLFEGVKVGKYELTEEELDLAIAIKGATSGPVVIIEVSTQGDIMFPGLYTINTTLRTANEEGYNVDYIGSVRKEVCEEDDYNEYIVNAIRDISKLEEFIRQLTERPILTRFHLKTIEELDGNLKDDMKDFARFHNEIP